VREVLASEVVTLERATPDMSPLVGNLLELYIHDLSGIFAVELGPDGRFGYPRLPLYWADSVGRHVYLIKFGSRVAGFAMVTRGSPASQNPTDLDVAEFFVLRAFRRSGVGRQAAFMLWDAVRGQWVVRVVETNEPGVSFWSETVRSYTSGMFAERVMPAVPTAWRVFTFASRATGQGPDLRTTI
jgi:predicted acetyltransferase